jgi:uncharacterized heparinase superfamily protein
MALSISRERLSEKGKDLCRHRFAFLNRPTVDLGKQIDWRDGANGDPLWVYCLHYGEWAVTLAQAFIATQDRTFRDKLIELLSSWIDHNPIASDPGWEPYPLSRRLVAWTRVGLVLLDDPIWFSFWNARLAPNLWQQARVLAANLEFDLSNNHLLANYRALAWIGLLFPKWPKAEIWLTTGLEGLWREMGRQVLPDGVHYERSISYHTIVLQDLLETSALCRRVGRGFPNEVEATLCRMVQFLVDLQAPDGTYPMLNDSVPEYPLDPRSVLLTAGLFLERQDMVSAGRGAGPTYAVWLMGESPTIQGGRAERVSTPPVKAYPDAGYVVLSDGKEDYLCFDAGPMGPDHLQGHGHADALSFVLHGGGGPMIVDPGVFSYHDRTWRDHFRSTRAHNTVTVDGQDQCVFWGPFRVAYPPKVRLLDWSEDHVTGEHEGYCRLRRPVIHKRRIERRGAGEWEILDHFEGRGDHEFALVLQLAQGATATLDGHGGADVRWPTGSRLEIKAALFPRGGNTSIEDGWISPGWNLKQKAPRYVLRWRASPPVETRIVLQVNP